MTARILVVDDDETIRTTLAQNLRTHGFEVVAAADGAEAADRFASIRPDLVLTDLAMPRADGFELIQRIRSNGATPIVVLSVRGGDLDKVRALDLGADDYVTKPFSTPELLARVRAQLRRVGAASRSQFDFDDLSIDVERHRVVQGGRELHLTPTEFSILELLARHAGRPVSFDEIIADVWKGAPGTSNDAVRVHVGSVRRKIEPDASNPRYIVTEPWIGFRFIAEPLG
ncbi:MAG TPA: response regulator transcription factor [Thermoanaerobaculia bacterium]|nr:response regulator transcription factor [Thermoanaerobaculia bacterium]